MGSGTSSSVSSPSSPSGASSEFPDIPADLLPRRRDTISWQVLMFVRSARQAYTPMNIRKTLGLPKNRQSAVNKACLRFLKAGLFVQPRPGFYLWSQKFMVEEFSRYEPYFDSRRPLEVHDLQAVGTLPGLYQTLAAGHFGSWRFAPQDVDTPRWLRVYDFEFPTGAKFTISVYRNDSVTVDVSSISNAPWTLDQYCAFHDRINGIFQELTGVLTAFDDFRFKRIHINQDDCNLLLKGPYMEIKVFRDTALALYQKKNRLRKEIKIEGGNGIPAHAVKRVIGVRDGLDLLVRNQNSLRVLNLFANVSEFLRKERELNRRMLGLNAYSQGRIEQVQNRLEGFVREVVQDFSNEPLKEELAIQLGGLGGALQNLSQDVGGGLMVLQDLAQDSQTKQIVLEHLHTDQHHVHNHLHEQEEVFTRDIGDIREVQGQILGNLDGMHRFLRTQERGCSTREQIKFALQSAPEGLTIKDLASQVGRHRKTVTEHLKRMADSNFALVEKIEGRPAIWRWKGGRS